MINRFTGSTWDFYQQIWNPSLEAITVIERNGIRIDPSECFRGLAEAANDTEQYTPVLDTWSDGMVSNWNSNKQVSEYLYKYREFPVSPVCGNLKAVKKTKPGKFPQDEAALDWLSKNVPDPWDREHIRILMKRNKSEKLATYCKKLPEYTDSQFRIHSVLKPDTDTGRLSSSNPALQQIPLEDKYHIRRAFVASPGHKLVVADMSQLEMYILADFSAVLFNDYALADDLQSADVHSGTAFRAWPWLSKYTTVAELKEHPEYGKYRKSAKTVNYSRAYGKTAYGLGAQIMDEDGNPIGVEAAQALLDATAYEGLTRYIEAIHAFAERTGYVETILGRRRLIPEARWKGSWKQQAAFRRAGNTPIQGSAADIMTLALLLCMRDKELMRIAWPCLQIHDEFIFECLEKHAEEVQHRVKYNMENAYHLTVPLRVDSNICENWAEGK